MNLGLFEMFYNLTHLFACRVKKVTGTWVYTEASLSKSFHVTESTYPCVEHDLGLRHNSSVTMFRQVNCEALCKPFEFKNGGM